MLRRIYGMIGRSRPLDEIQAQALAGLDPTPGPYDSLVERRERADYSRIRARRVHPLVRAFGNTIIDVRPRILRTIYPDQEIGVCVIGGREIRFLYFLPHFRMVFDQLAVGETEDDASQRGQWCRDHGLIYHHIAAQEVFDTDALDAIARRAKEEVRAP